MLPSGCCMRTHDRFAGRVTLALAMLLLPLTLQGQVPEPERPAAAPTYLERYREVKALGSGAGRVADVDHLVLTRDAGQLTLEHGRLFLLAPIGGRTVGAVFPGQRPITFPP